MTPEEKKLLLKDLCCRLPYEVKIHVGKTQRIEVFEDINLCIGSINNTYADVKPYLFPLSSLTEEQKEEYVGLQQRVIYNSKGLINSDVMEYVNWCYKNHIDINNLIPMGLALDATGLNIY